MIWTARSLAGASLILFALHGTLAPAQSAARGSLASGQGTAPSDLAVPLQRQGLSKYVDCFTGTGGTGHTFPGATVPFGMVQLSPDTRVDGWEACAGYHEGDSTILGFSHTHLSGTGVADYGDILVVPRVGGAVEPSPAAMAFRHADESAAPGYYRVSLAGGKIIAELTAGRRIGVHRYTFARSDTASIIIDLIHGLGPDRVISSDIRVVGCTELTGFRRSAGWANDQRIYFVARFSRPFDSFGTTLGDSVMEGVRSAQGTAVRAYVRFPDARGRPLVLCVGLSGVSVEGARRNLEAELRELRPASPGQVTARERTAWTSADTFDLARTRADRLWERELRKIAVRGATPAQMTTFYSALYHTMIAPNLFSDADGSYRGMDGKVHTARGFDMYTVFSLWDTFRAEHPLLTIIDRKRTHEFVRSLLARADESGLLPVWELASNETWCMIGYHAVPVIVDAYMKGIRGFDPVRALEAGKRSAGMDHLGLGSYQLHGFVPAEASSESVSRTLEYAYDDWCLSRMAAALGRNADARAFAERARYYRNVFDPTSGFMRARVKGGWAEPFDPRAVTGHYTEANAWQYSFFVPHDIPGLIGLEGGKERFASRLDAFFSREHGLTGTELVDITGMIGQYAHGNEPGHHVPYLYDDAGMPWKTEALVRHIMDSLYAPGPAGLCGNDDCGQLSAWYVMSALGFYQVTPGLPEYSLGSPLFPEAVIHLENGRSFTIRADGNGAGSPFVRSAMLNGMPLEVPRIAHAAIASGGSLDLQMTDHPSQWGTGMQHVNILAVRDRAHLSERTVASEPFVAVPVFTPGGRSFRDSLLVTLASPTPGARIFYTLDGADPLRAGKEYRAPIRLTGTTSVTAAALLGAGRSRPMTVRFTSAALADTTRRPSRGLH